MAHIENVTHYEFFFLLFDSGEKTQKMGELPDATLKKNNYAVIRSGLTSN
jgi:hypothetical protein